MNPDRLDAGQDDRARPGATPGSQRRALRVIAVALLLLVVVLGLRAAFDDTTQALGTVSTVDPRDDRT